MHLRLTAVLASATVAVALALTAGCSSADDTKACNKILEEIQNVGTEASSQSSDPTALGDVYTSAGADIRSAADGASDEVQTAAKNLATSLEELGSSMSNLDPTDPQVPDTSAFLDAGSQMESACN